MVGTSLDELDNRRRGYIFRGVMAGLVVLLMIASVVTPHLMVVAATEYAGRSLIPASRFFLLAQAGAEGFAGGVRRDQRQEAAGQHLVLGTPGAA